jgi:hypothetical protein
MQICIYLPVHVNASALRRNHYGVQYSWFLEHDYVERMGGKGRRWCFIHAKQESTLIDEALLDFEAKKIKSDYMAGLTGRFFNVDSKSNYFRMCRCIV